MDFAVCVKGADVWKNADECGLTCITNRLRTGFCESDFRYALALSRIILSGTDGLCGNRARRGTKREGTGNIRTVQGFSIYGIVFQLFLLRME